MKILSVDIGGTNIKTLLEGETPDLKRRVPSGPEFTPHDMVAAINEMRITIPLVVIHTPLPGTQEWRARRGDLLTEDARLFDLLHAVTETYLPRKEFYENYARWNDATMESTDSSLTWRFIARRPRMFLALRRGARLFAARREILRDTLRDPETYMRDEHELIEETRARLVAS